MPDGTLLHLRDTYPIETAWAPKWVGDELRQVRTGARQARLAGIRAAAEAAAAQRRGQHEEASRQQGLAASYQAMHDAYAEREATFAAVMADRMLPVAENSDEGGALRVKTNPVPNEVTP